MTPVWPGCRTSWWFLLILYWHFLVVSLVPVHYYSKNSTNVYKVACSAMSTRLAVLSLTCQGYQWSVSNPCDNARGWLAELQDLALANHNWKAPRGSHFIRSVFNIRLRVVCLLWQINIHTRQKAPVLLSLLLSKGSVSQLVGRGAALIDSQRF